MIESTVTSEERSRAKLSFAMDIIWSLATGIFLVAWLDAMDQNETGKGTYVFYCVFGIILHFAYFLPSHNYLYHIWAQGAFLIESF